MLAPTAAAATFNVNTTVDHVEDKSCVAPSDCTLRDALSLAGSADTINVPTGTYTLTQGELSLLSDHIAGSGARSVVISGGNASRVFSAAGSTTIAGVTIRDGTGTGTAAPGAGGGVYVAAEAIVTISNSTITANTAQSGGGLYTAGTVGLVSSTVSGNSASTIRLTNGGGITATGGLALVNTTVSGNSAIAEAGGSSQGGGIASSGALSFNNVTIAQNTAVSAGGLLENGAVGGPSRTIANTIVTGGCGGTGLASDSTHNNLSDDATCAFAGTGDRQSTPAQLGALANNGGATNTHALPPASPAINTGASCATADQRGVARPQPCDVGAYEYRAPTLRVITAVTNDAGGTRTAAGFTVHVRQGAADVTGSPQAGNAAGTTYTLAAGGTYVVDADAVAGYTEGITGTCAANGSITLAEGQNATCTVTEGDIAPTLRVITQVVNDDGGTLDPGNFTARVTGTATNFSAPGTANGTLYTLAAARRYTISVDTVSGYAAAVTGSCAADGTITLALAQNLICTITLDDGAPELTVVTNVVNDDGGTATPASFPVHVRSGAVDVVGSPKPGSAAGTVYPLAAGTYRIAADTGAGYTTAMSGDCPPDGSVTLTVGASGLACTLTLNDVAPTLTVVTKVVNDSGGTRGPAAFTVHVRRGSTDVGGSPRAGSASGTRYTLTPGTYAVASDAVAGYSVTGCTVALQPGDVKTCTVVATDAARVVTGSRQLPPPQRGKNVNATQPVGPVKVKLPGTSAFVPMDEDLQIPLGTVVDVTKGRVTIIPSANEKAVFYGGVFKLGQTKGKKPITVLSLIQKLTGCKKTGKARAAAKKKKTKKRRLWGDGKGRFRTKGKHSAATVVGTKWLVEDRCTSTLTRVARGKVSVRDFATRKTVLVKQGKKYVARAR